MTHNVNIGIRCYAVDSELHELLVTLRNTKVSYNRICARMRSRGVDLNEHNEKYYSDEVDELISIASCLASEELYHEITKGGL